MIASEPEPGAVLRPEPPARVLGPALLVVIVLMLGIWIPAPLRAVLADAAHALGGPAP